MLKTNDNIKKVNNNKNNNDTNKIAVSRNLVKKINIKIPNFLRFFTKIKINKSTHLKQR